RPYGKVFLGTEAIPAFREALTAVPFEPDLVCIFSGYDAHQDDCGRKITNWTEQEFEVVTQLVLSRAGRCQCPVLSVHGGGYKLQTVIDSAARHVATLATFEKG